MNFPSRQKLDGFQPLYLSIGPYLGDEFQPLSLFIGPPCGGPAQQRSATAAGQTRTHALGTRWPPTPQLLPQALQAAGTASTLLSIHKVSFFQLFYWYNAILWTAPV